MKETAVIDATVVSWTVQPVRRAAGGAYNREPGGFGARDASLYKLLKWEGLSN